MNQRTDIIIANNATNLFIALENIRDGRTATVEAEFGQSVVEGSVATLAHHVEKFKNEECPCLADNDVADTSHLPMDRGLDAIGISHFDLDTLGGILACLGRKPDAHEFWETAAYVDVFGVHRLLECGPSQETIDRLNAFWAWSEDNRIFPPRDGSAEYVTEFVLKAEEVLNKILADEENLMRQGRLWAGVKGRLNTTTFRTVLRKTIGTVILRIGDSFTNHLYETPETHNYEVCDGVLSFNTRSCTITLSFADGGDTDRDACKIMQSAFGNAAGGHRGIAGSPRGVELTEADLDKVIGLL